MTKYKPKGKGGSNENVWNAKSRDAKNILALILIKIKGCARICWELTCRWNPWERSNSQEDRVQTSSQVELGSLNEKLLRDLCNKVWLP